MKFKVKFHRGAYKELKQIPDKMAIKILEAIFSLTNKPYQGKPLKGNLMTLYSLRLGDYRVIYHVNKKTRTITIARIGHRKEVYLSKTPKTSSRD